MSERAARNRSWGLILAAGSWSCGGGGREDPGTSGSFEDAAPPGVVEAGLDDGGLAGDVIEGGAIDAGAQRDASAPDAALADGRLADYCEAWISTVCELEVECCAARGYRVSVGACSLPARPRYFLQQPACRGQQVTPAHFDEAAARECLELQPELYRDCRAASRDTDVYARAVSSCERIAPREAPGPGEPCESSDLDCQAPPQMVSLCELEIGGGSFTSCSEPIAASTEGASCVDSSRCDVGLICGLEQTCVPPAERGAACNVDFQCASGYCDGTCSEAPPLDDARCETLERLAEEALYVEDGVGSWVVVSGERLLWPGYYGLRGEGLHHAPKDGSGPVVHLTVEGSGAISGPPFLGDDDFMYTIEDGVVQGIALDDGSRESLGDVGFDGLLRGMSADDLLVVNPPCSRLSKVSKQDGSIWEHPESQDSHAASNTPHVAVDGAWTYCARDATVVRFGDGGELEVVTQAAVEAQGWVLSLEILDGKLHYWVAGTDDTDQLRILDPETGGLEQVPTPEPPQSRLFADREQRLLFWTTGAGIRQWSPETGEFTLVEPSVPPLRELAFDATHFYWRFEEGIYRWPRR